MIESEEHQPQQEPRRIPLHEDYLTVAQKVGDRFQTEGGAWVSYHKETLIHTQNHTPTRSLFEAVSSLAKLVEPVTDDDFKPVDSLYAATHAFRAGMWTAGRMTHLLYEGRLGYEGVHNALAQSLPHFAYTKQEQYEENGEFLVGSGRRGLIEVGDDTREQLNKWGDEIVSDERVRGYYALGAGAILSVSHYIYSTAYPRLQEDFLVSQLFSTEELMQYLQRNPDSSSN